MAFAAVLGGIMFFARLQGVYIAILTLVVSLLLGTFMRQTADPSYTIGAAYLGGMNGLRPASLRRSAVAESDLWCRRSRCGNRRPRHRVLLLHACVAGFGLFGLSLACELDLRLFVDRLPGRPRANGNVPVTTCD